MSYDCDIDCLPACPSLESDVNIYMFNYKYKMEDINMKMSIYID